MTRPLRRIRRTALLSTVAAIALAWGALRPSAAEAQGLPGAPPPFDKGGVSIAVVSYLSGSDFLQAYEVGAARQARALGLHIRLSEAQQDPDKLRSLVQQAINLHVQGIVINNGTKEALTDVVRQAQAAGIKVVTYDLDLGLPGVPVVEQDDREMADIVLARALADEGGRHTPQDKFRHLTAQRGLTCGEEGPKSKILMDMLALSGGNNATAPAMPTAKARGIRGNQRSSRS